MSSWKSNELFIVESESQFVNDVLQVKDGTASTSDPVLTPSETSTWADEQFSSKKPIFIFDSEYAGLYLPKNFDDSDSFVGQLASDSSMIAPTALSSEDFVKALTCSMYYSDGSLGDAYKNARNTYYRNVENPKDLPGLSLMSYELYGTPYASYSLPGSPSPDEVDEACFPYTKGGTVNVPLELGGSKSGAVAQGEMWGTNLNVQTDKPLLKFKLTWQGDSNALKLVIVSPTQVSQDFTNRIDLSTGIEVPSENGEWIVKVFRNTKSSRFMDFELKVGTYSVECYEQILTPYS